MPKRKIVLHGVVNGTPAATQKYILTVTGELSGAMTAAEVKEIVFKAAKKFAKEIPGAQEFWVSQPRARRTSGAKMPLRPRAPRSADESTLTPRQRTVQDAVAIVGT